jgi:hypothetical protein
MLNIVRAAQALMGNARTRDFLATLGGLMGSAGDLAPELCSCLDGPITEASTATGCPILLLAAVVSVQQDGSKDWWTAERCHAAARALQHFTSSQGIGPGLLAYCAGAGDHARELAGRIAGAYFLLSARSVDVGALQQLAEAV